MPETKPVPTGRPVDTTSGKEPVWLNILTTIIKQFGIPTTLLLALGWFFIKFGTIKQKEEFIDKFILFNGIQDNPIPFILVVISLIVVLVLNTLYYRNVINTKQIALDRATQEKTDLQNKLLNQ